MILNKSYLKELIDREYGIEIFCLEREEGRNVNSKNFKIKNITGEPFLLKAVSKENKQLPAKIEIAAKCRNKMAKLPELAVSRKGDSYVEGDSWFFILMKYYSGDKFCHKSEEIKSAARSLAILNQKLKKFKKVFKRSSLYQDLNEPDLMVIRKSLGEDKFSRLVRRLCENLLENYKEVNLAIRGDIGNNQLAHMDYHVDNVLFRDNKVEVILDIDAVLFVPELQSLAFAADRFCQNSEEVRIFVEGYQSEGIKLSTKELKLLRFFAKREALNRINYILRSHFFEKNSDWNFDLGKHVRALKKTEKFIKS